VTLGSCLIGIAGASCSGKTAIATHLAARLAATVLSLDHYYRDLSHLPLAERARQNFDHPEMLDWGLIREHVAALAQGREVLKPVYDFAVHARSGALERIVATPMMIVEGIFALYDEAVRECCSTRVFVSLADEVCLARRLERDVRERGRTRESVLRQYEESVRPMCERYVLPAREFAHVVVAGDAPLEVCASAILTHVRGG
jgi:uridine kinase